MLKMHQILRNGFRIFPLATFLLALHLHLFFAILHNFHNALPLLAIFILVYTLFVYQKLLRHLSIGEFDEAIDKTFGAVQIFKIPKFLSILKIAFPSLLILGFLIWLFFDSTENPIRRRSLLGFIVSLCLCYTISTNHFRVNWQPVIGGIFLQIAVGFLILRWPPGSVIFQWVSEKVVTFLEFTSVGTNFVYGFAAKPPNICGMNVVFYFTALQIIIYFGAIVAILYHFGVMQSLLSKLAFAVQSTIGTTSAESMNAAACIFLGQTEAALLIGPSIGSMTNSEVHCIMTAGFTCIAGSLFSAYISFGACPIHLLSATIMNASIALAISKMVYPETDESKHKNLAQMDFLDRDMKEGLIECISKSSVKSARFVLAIGANLVVYISLLALLNSLIGWAGSLIGLKGLSFNKLLSFLFFPLAWAIGASDSNDFKTSIDETIKVAELMGVKTVLNEFIAYQQLSQMISNGTLNGARARMIATYVLCGFSNIAMIGNQIGVLSAICPEQKKTFANVAVRSFLAGVFCCFLTACVAGMLIDTPIVCESTFGSDKKCIQLEKFIANSTTL